MMALEGTQTLTARAKCDLIEGCTVQVAPQLKARLSDVKVVKTSDLPKEPVSSPLFTGTQVFRQLIIDPAESESFNFSIVNFSAGSRNKFTHDMQEALEESGLPLIQRLLELAGQGNSLSASTSRPRSRYRPRTRPITLSPH